MAKMGFNAREVAPAQPFDVLPKGWYAMAITESENKSIAKGERLSLEFTVDAGKAKGRKVFDGINWKHENSEAQRIGQEQLSAICHATGILDLADDKMLVGKKLAVKLGIEDARTEGDKQYDARNITKGFKPISELSESEKADTNVPKAGGTPMGANAPADAPDWMKNAETSGPATTPDVPASPPAPVAKTDDERLAEAGWTQHPTSAPHWYKGQEVLLKADALGKLAPAAPDAPPAAPANAASTASAPAAAPAATPPAASAPATESAAAAGDTPPWLQS